jgi:hypothetical protein
MVVSHCTISQLPVADVDAKKRLPKRFVGCCCDLGFGFAAKKS